MRNFMMAAALAITVIGGAAEAAGPLNLRQHNQLRRIDNGVRTGALNGRERSALRGQQRHIEREAARRRARHGGKLTGADKRYLHGLQARANHDIKRLKHNRHHG